MNKPYYNSKNFFQLNTEKPNTTLDIIIPSYNSKETLKRLLYSIAIQRDFTSFKVYIVNDSSNYKYTNIINFFKNFFDITELYLKKNMGPGFARQYGIDHSTSKYITFIDADDYLFSPHSLYNLSYKFCKNYDLIITSFLLETPDQNIIIKNDYTWLHGKAFKREFLYNNSIRFNNTRANEDNGFNYLVKFHKPETFITDITTYVYSYNPNSITRKDNCIYEFYNLEYFAYNIQWAINCALNKKIQSYDIILVSLKSLITMYFFYLEFYNKYDVKKICIWSKELKKIFDNFYKKYISNLMIDKEINLKNDEYAQRNININFKVTFFEFLQLIEEVSNDWYNNAFV